MHPLHDRQECERVRDKDRDRDRFYEHNHDRHGHRDDDLLLDSECLVSPLQYPLRLGTDDNKCMILLFSLLVI